MGWKHTFCEKSSILCVCLSVSRSRQLNRMLIITELIFDVIQSKSKSKCRNETIHAENKNKSQLWYSDLCVLSTRLGVSICTISKMNVISGTNLVADFSIGIHRLHPRNQYLLCTNANYTGGPLKLLIFLMGKRAKIRSTNG